MTISEKLILIAENMQKIYDAGFAAGLAQSGNNLNSSFTIYDPDELEYTIQYKPGLSWFAFIDSEDNPMVECATCGERYRLFDVNDIDEVVVGRSHFNIPMGEECFTYAKCLADENGNHVTGPMPIEFDRYFVEGLLCDPGFSMLAHCPNCGEYYSLDGPPECSNCGWTM